MKHMANNGLTTQIPIKNKAGQVVGYKDVVTYRGLLAKAHDEQLKGIETAVVQLPTKDNRLTAVFHAKVSTSKGTFTGVGDANPENVNSQIVPHLIRMAETRAKARALRDAVNIGVVCLEELGGEVEDGSLVEVHVEARETRLPTSMSGGQSAADATDKNMPEKGNGQDRHEGNDNGSGSTTRAASTLARTPAPPASPGTPPMSTPSSTPQPSPQRGKAGNGDSMSENQRRYLFRLLAQKGVMGERARIWLEDTLGVKSLRDVAKSQASELIDRLVHEDSGNGDGQEVANGCSM